MILGVRFCSVALVTHAIASRALIRFWSVRLTAT
jgi:hypothetical protein